MIPTRLIRLAEFGDLNLVQKLELYIRMQHSKERKSLSPQVQDLVTKIGSIMETPSGEHGESLSDYMEKQNLTLHGRCEGYDEVADPHGCDNDTVTVCSACGLEVCLVHSDLDFESGLVRCTDPKCKKLFPY